MTLDEREQLTRFLQLLEQAQTGPKDPEAEALIRQAAARQPDAAYLLVLRTLQLEIAQQAADAEIARLARELEKTRTALPPSTGSFLAGGNAWGRQPSAPGSPAQAAAQPLAQAPASARGPGLLGTVASTAAGVVAGSLLFQGIGSLMGNHNKAATPDSAATPPGGGTLVETDYGAAGQQADAGYAAEDFADSGDTGDVG